MPKIYIYVLLALLCGYVLVLSVRYYRTRLQISTIATHPTGGQSSFPTIKPQPLKKSVFVPYWTDFAHASDLRTYDRVIYFGVTPTFDGINDSEPGYKNISTFMAAAAAVSEKWLTLRMTDSQANVSILKSEANWKKIADDTVAVVHDNHFDGLVIDLELSSLVLDDLTENINGFMQRIVAEAKAQNIKVGIAMYGDVFYRHRQFDVQKLARLSDEMLIMAYDFHKSIGEPGPNFPLHGKEKYGYDFATMLEEYLQIVPTDKLSVVFGRYGYDWVVDEKKRPFKAATPVTDAQVKARFLGKCQWKNCVVTRDHLSAETEVNYIDDALNYHVVWFEDLESVNTKLALLKQKGIFSYAFWAYGYY